MSRVFLLCWRLPILPGRFQPSIVGTSELNCRVRDGNGCTLTVISTNLLRCSLVQEPSELNKVTLKSVWKEPAAGRGHHTASCQNVFVYICSNIVGQALDLLVLSS